MKQFLVFLIALLILSTIACVEQREPLEKEEATEPCCECEPIEKLDDLKDFVDKKVCVTGKVSSEPWQHLMAPPDSFPVSTYFDVGDKQTVVYSTKELACPNCKCEIKIMGTVLKVQGKGKGSKADEDYIEFHIIADSWTCLDEKKEDSGGK